jgi:long-chain acyl-CoA synthetase
MLGYWNNPEATQEAIVTLANGERVFRTGDRGRLVNGQPRNASGPASGQAHSDRTGVCGAGVLTITGRIKDQYKLSNGKFVHPDHLENALVHSPYIQQAFVFGLDRPHNVALLWIDGNAIATALDLPTSEVASLLANHGPAVSALLQQEVHTANQAPDVKAYEAVKRFVVVPHPLTVDGGFLTQKMSIKRPAVQAAFQPQLDALYTPD